MMTQNPAAGRLPLRAARTAFLALLLVGLPLAAQSRSSHGASGGGGGRTAHGSGSPSSSPSMRGSSAPHSSGGSSGYNSGGRSAHPVPGAGGSTGHRQPSGHGHGGYYGGHGHGGYYGGHGGWYYPGWGWGFYPDFSWWWWDEPYDPYYYPYYRYPGSYPGYYDRYYDRSDMGALDLDVSPGRTHVFVDGEDLGIVDRYDGWPGYLWLPRGTYDVAFYLDGYKTISRQITIYPGTVIDIDDRMEEGQSVRPEDLGTKTHERRDERLRYEQQRREDLERQGYRDDDDKDMRDRAPQSNGAHLELTVEPDDASVYLDGRFVGTGSDLATHGGLRVAPGQHRLAIVRPGHRAVEKDFQADDGQEVKLDIRLEGGSR